MLFLIKRVRGFSVKKILLAIAAGFLLTACSKSQQSRQTEIPKKLSYSHHGKAQQETAGRYENKIKGFSFYFLPEYFIHSLNSKHLTVELIKHGNIKMDLYVMNRNLSLSGLKRKAKKELLPYQTEIIRDYSLQDDPFFKNATIYKIKSKKVFVQSILFTLNGKPFIAVIHEPLLMDHTPQFYAMLKSMQIL